MKNNIIVLILAITATLSCTSKPIKVPDAVKAAFATRFPTATKVEWGKESANEYEAEFKFNNTDVAANFGKDGSWVVTETVIPESELPEAVKVAVNTKYPGAAITLVEKTEKPGDKIIYEVAVKVNGKKETVDINPADTAGKIVPEFCFQFRNTAGSL